MVKYGIISALVIGMLAVSCGERSRKKVVKQTVKTPLIHPLFFQEEIAAQVNFPFWFNDSLIRAQHIRTITWTAFHSMEAREDAHDGQEAKSKTVYTFDESGRLIALHRSDYAEGLTISSKHYAFSPVSPAGYARVKQQQLTHLGDEDADGPFTFTEPVANRKSILQFDDNYADVRYHFFPDKKYRGALSIDSIAHPGSTDWIIWGTPSRPEKRYQVDNTVTESSVTHYTYLNANYPKMIDRTDYPFTQKRYFTYSKSGVFTGFIDSIYVDNSFVRRNVSWFRFDRNKRPSRILHRKGHEGSGTGYETVETIRYTTFPSL